MMLPSHKEISFFPIRFMHCSCMVVSDHIILLVQIIFPHLSKARMTNWGAIVSPAPERDLLFIEGKEGGSQFKQFTQRFWNSQYGKRRRHELSKYVSWHLHTSLTVPFHDYHVILNARSTRTS